MAVKKLYSEDPLHSRVLGIPYLRRVELEMDPTDYAGLFTTPIVLVPAIAGKMVVPERFQVLKEAGTAWTPGAGNFQVIHTGEGSTQFNVAKAGFFDSSAAQIAFGMSTSFPSYVGSVHAQVGTDLVFRYTSADMTGGTGKLRISVWYRIWESAVSGGDL